MRIVIEPPSFELRACVNCKHEAATQDEGGGYGGQPRCANPESPFYLLPLPRRITHGEGCEKFEAYPREGKGWGMPIFEGGHIVQEGHPQ